MTQELAKQLKDAGFPQPARRSAAAHIPTLSELIKECGKYLWHLRHTPDNKWIASGHFAGKDSQIPYYESVSYDEPEVAVAELYLALKLHDKK